MPLSIAILLSGCITSVGVFDGTGVDADRVSRMRDVIHLSRTRAIVMAQVRLRKGCIECGTEARSTTRREQYGEPGTKRRAGHEGYEAPDSVWVTPSRSLETPFARRPMKKSQPELRQQRHRFHGEWTKQQPSPRVANGHG